MFYVHCRARTLVDVCVSCVCVCSQLSVKVFVNIFGGYPRKKLAKAYKNIINIYCSLARSLASALFAEPTTLRSSRASTQTGRKGSPDWLGGLFGRRFNCSMSVLAFLRPKKDVNKIRHIEHVLKWFSPPFRFGLLDFEKKSTPSLLLPPPCQS